MVSQLSQLVLQHQQLLGSRPLDYVHVNAFTRQIPYLRIKHRCAHAAADAQHAPGVAKVSGIAQRAGHGRELAAHRRFAHQGGAKAHHLHQQRYRAGLFIRAADSQRYALAVLDHAHYHKLPGPRLGGHVGRGYVDAHQSRRKQLFIQHIIHSNYLPAIADGAQRHSIYYITD